MTEVTIPGGSGTVPVRGTLIVDGPVAATDTIAFSYSHRGGSLQSGTLIINDVSTFQGRVRNYFDLTTIRFVDPVTSVVVDPRPDNPPPANGLIPALVKVFIGDVQVTSFVVEPSVGDGWYGLDTFTLSPDGGAMVLSTSHTRCFAAGTRLPTARGEIAVEDIRVGDAMPTALGGCWRRVRWVGWRSVEVARHPRPWDVAPVRIRAGAFGPGQPRIDLVLSPDHAIHLSGRLIPVRYLLNGATIVQEQVARITYHHVELADARGEAVHDTILAAGLPVETFLDTAGRADFANGGIVVKAVPDFARDMWAKNACAPLVLDGPHLVAARWQTLREAERLGWRLEDDAAPRLVFGGRTLIPDRHGDTLRFRLPPRTRRGRLVSRTFVPAHVQPDSSDHRTLGLGIAHLKRDGKAAAIHDAPAEQGWHDAEADCRWTTGETVIDCAGARVLDIVLARGGRYWAADSAAAARTA
jgi:hypothetical protein